jgi:hypothetical protein
MATSRSCIRTLSVISRARQSGGSPESRTAPATLGTQPAPRWYRHSVVRTGAPVSPLPGSSGLLT